VVELGEWSVLVEVPSGIPDEVADAVSAAVMAALRRWAEGAEERIGLETVVTVRVLAKDLAGL
jgi:phytoene dehydrogenase-like protein